jgi:tetratricopeptide (TPR) repeat protein
LGNLERAAHFQISAGTPSEEARFDDLLADASKGERKALALLADANEVPLFASSEAAALWKMLLWAPIQFQLNPMLVLRNLQSLLEEAQARQDLGRAALDRGDYDSASDLYWEASVLFRRLGYLLGEAECLRRLGDVALRRGSSGTAQLRYEEALVRYRSAGGRRGQVYCFEMLGRIAREQSAVLQLDQ